MATWCFCSCAVRSSPQTSPAAVDELATTIRPFGDSSPWDGVGHVAYQPRASAVLGSRKGRCRTAGWMLRRSQFLYRQVAGRSGGIGRRVGLKHR
jgi:hypothetical protein